MQTLTLSFQEFIDTLILEKLHPELQDIIKSPATNRSKKAMVVAKLMDLKQKGERTGIEGTMPSGSSRAYLKHDSDHPITLDGKKTTIPTGIKFAIKAKLDAHHASDKYDGMSLGGLQNKAENEDHLINSQYRIIGKQGNGQYKTNHHNGIFPPLIDHDSEHHEWAHTGHCPSVTQKEFKEITKTDTHPNGITHMEFCDAMERGWNQMHGRYHTKMAHTEAKLDHIDTHPLVQKFTRHMVDFDNPPYDYAQLGNMGKWHHPIDKKWHIVARDHGFNREVMDAYSDARGSMRDNA
jgi:hypothetical protein